MADVEFLLDGRAVSVPDDGTSLLEALRERIGERSAKDGCSPQGQCGCCTVLVDGRPRVACVTPVARVRGRQITTLAGLDESVRDRWAAAMCATGGSQCGFCTPGIIVRLAGLSALNERSGLSDPSGLTGEPAVNRRVVLDHAAVDRALAAHLCRCTGWQTIHEAAAALDVAAPTATVGSAAAGDGGRPSGRPVARPSGRPAGRDLEAAARRAGLEGRTPQAVGSFVALGAGGFADDGAPADALVAVPAADGSWAIGETVADARRAAGTVLGRRTTAPLSWPLALPDGDWVRTLRTTWVEPAYLEPDASWCVPGGEPASALGNGGAFGGKLDTNVGTAARALADLHGRAVRVVLSRQDIVRLGPKRPPMAVGIRADGSGVVRVVRTTGIAQAVQQLAPAFVVEEVDVVGLRTSVALRGSGWAEAAVLLASLAAGAPDAVRSPDGAEASAWIEPDGTVRVRVSCGEVLDAVVLRSYCIGAAHMALGWVRREGVSVDADGNPHDLTIRSVGVLRAAETPPIEVDMVESDADPVNGSDAVFAAVAAAAWRHAGFPAAWPCAR